MFHDVLIEFGETTKRPFLNPLPVCIREFIDVLESGERLLVGGDVTHVREVRPPEDSFAPEGIEESPNMIVHINK